MKINILYEENMKNGHKKYTTIEIPDGDYSMMIEIDYQQRLAETPEDKKDQVKKCETVQEVFDLMNKREYNSWHTENRHRTEIRAPFTDDESDEEIDGLDYVVDNTDKEKRDYKFEYEALCQKIREVLTPEYADVLIATALDDVTPEEYADMHDLKRDTVYKRLQRAKKKYLKFL
ncbi:MAG: RNA polymerase sigma factor [Lachnospira eligens]|jgi:DNA-directed RNA polymerase specialized sigma24 family protein